MGLSSFACVPKQHDLHHVVRVVFPDGRIERLRRSCSVHEILQGNPDYFVCGGTAHTLTSRMGAHEQLEKGFTYFVCCLPNAPPFQDIHAKGQGPGASVAGLKFSPRFFRRGLSARENRGSPTHHGNSKVFDFHSATLQVEDMKGELLRQQHVRAAPRHLRLVFFRECLQSLRLPRSLSDILEPPPPLPSPPSPSAPPSPSSREADLLRLILRSEAKFELGLHAAQRRDEPYHRRSSRRRRRAQWTANLQSIPENSPVTRFRAPAPPPPPPEPESSRISPPRLTKNISPPRHRGPPRNISPPRRVHFIAELPKASSAPPPPPPPPPQQRKPNNQRALYIA